MKTFSTLILGAALVIGLTSMGPGPAKKADTQDFCENLKKILESGKTTFQDIRGAETTKTISGRERKFFETTTTLEFEGAEPSVLGSSLSHPEYIQFLAVEPKPMISAELSAKYDEAVKVIKDCIGSDENWTIKEFDASNSSFLEGTKHKKLVATSKEMNDAGKSVKLSVFMYRYGNETKRVVELKVAGLGESKY